MEGESSAKRSRVDSSDSVEGYEINDINNSPQSSDNVEDFVKIAKDLIKDHSFLANNPSLYKVCQVYVKKMFVEWHKKNKNSEENLEHQNVVESFENVRDLNTNCEEYLTLDSENTRNSGPNPEQFDEKLFIKFVKIHQIIALKNLFTTEDDFCELDSDDALPMNEIHNYGLVKNCDGIVIFSYKILRDFFAAEYILKIFKDHHLEENCNKCVKMFIGLMLGREYEIIRTFIDEGLAPQEELNDTNLHRDQNEAERINLTIEELEEKFIDGGGQNSIDKNEENSKKDKSFGKKLLKNLKNRKTFSEYLRKILKITLIFSSPFFKTLIKVKPEKFSLTIHQ